MSKYARKLLINAAEELKGERVLNHGGAWITLFEPLFDEPQFQRPKNKDHGDWSTNFALQYGNDYGINPRDLAQKLVDKIHEVDPKIRIEIAGPGFLNFYLRSDHQAEILNQILDKQNLFGHSKKFTGKKVKIEFVSANPTGPLHVGHGRGAAYGATIANLLEAVGYEVYREYYVNDAGRQMDILTVSVWLRYLELCGDSFDFPCNAYQGDYIWDIAASLHREYENQFYHSTQLWMQAIPPDEPNGGDKEIHIDAIINKSKELLGDKDYEIFADRALNTILNDIKDDLEKFDVHFNQWYSEKSLVKSNKVQTALDTLTSNGHTYTKDGAIWFRSTDFGDEKDRVLVRENGQPTYFASDVAYHLDKYEREYDLLIDIWGADHHGYIARVKAAIEALGQDPERLRILLVQFANLYEGGKKLTMSTRSGEFVTLRQLRKQVGKDAARFFYVMRKCEQHLDFDLDLATSQSQDNPVYYVQYAHARICSIFEQAGNQLEDNELIDADSSLLDQTQEKGLINILDQFPEKVISAADQFSPHIVVNYLRDLANTFHSFYNAHQVLVDDLALRNARLKLIRATQIVLKNGLTLLDVSAPQHM